MSTAHVDGLLQSAEVGRAEAATEIAGRRGIGNTIGPERVEEGFVVASELDVLEAGAAQQRVVGDAEHMIGLVIGQMEFQHVQVFVDRLGQADVLDERMNEADAAATNRPVPLRNVVVDVPRRERRPRMSVRAVAQATINLALAFPPPRPEDSSHSKSFRGRLVSAKRLLHPTPETAKDFGLFT